jgi:hypothetical protein
MVVANENPTERAGGEAEVRDDLSEDRTNLRAEMEQAAF